MLKEVVAVLLQFGEVFWRRLRFGHWLTISCRCRLSELDLDLTIALADLGLSHERCKWLYRPDGQE